MGSLNPEKAYLEYWEHPELKQNPRYQQWKEYELGGIERGRNFAQLLSRHISLPGKKILDTGSGDGGLAIAFAQVGSKVTALEPEPERIYRSQLRFRGYRLGIDLVQGKAENLPFPAGYFDLVMACDLIEHVEQPEGALGEMSRVLKSEGILFLTGPNRFSPIHFLSDCHFGLFGISILPHSWASWYVTKIRKRSKIYYVGVFPIYTRTAKRISRRGLRIIETNFPSLPEPASESEGRGQPAIPCHRPQKILRNLKLGKICRRFADFSYNFREFFWILARKESS